MSDQETFEDNFEAAFEPEETEPLSEESLEQTPLSEPEAPQTFEYAGRTFTTEQLEPVAKFATWANENPERWEKLQRWESGEIDFSSPVVQEAVIQAPPETELADDFDPFDEDYLRGIGKKLQEIETRDVRQREAEGRASVDAGITTFSQAHTDLSKDDMNSILKWVHDRGTLAFIPEDLPYGAKQQAVAERFEEGYKVLFYDRIRADETRQVVTDMEKRRRASQSSGSGVSSPRVKPAPTTDAEKKQAYVDDVAQALNEAT